MSDPIFYDHLEWYRGQSPETEGGNMSRRPIVWCIEHNDRRHFLADVCYRFLYERPDQSCEFSWGGPDHRWWEVARETNEATGWVVREGVDGRVVLSNLTEAEAVELADLVSTVVYRRDGKPNVCTASYERATDYDDGSE